MPLTVSPFLSIPTAVTLPYTFRSVPASLPPSVLSDSQNGERTNFVKSASGHAANPEDIIASCQKLQQHMSKSVQDALHLIKSWETEIKERDLAEKRRVAPGWLDRDEKILEPKKSSGAQVNQDLLEGGSAEVDAPVMSPSREGAELDKVFGSMRLK